MQKLSSNEEGSNCKSAVDILVNAAGVMYFTMMKNVRVEEWDRTIDVCVKGNVLFVLCCKGLSLRTFL